MIFTTKAEYGVRLLIQLGVQGGDSPVSLKSVAEAENMPLAYLERIAALLKKAGLVTSTRGAHGGYVLARSPDTVRVGEVYRVMEGPVAPMECVSEDITEQTCPLIDGCETRPVWLRMRDAIAETLDSTTLADLIKDSPRARAEVREPAAAAS